MDEDRTFERHRQLESVAARLRGAYANGAVEPLRDALEASDQAGAYAVQHINTAFWKGQGRRVSGRKVGLTATAVQRQLGVDQPDYGVLFSDMEVEHDGVLARRLLQPKVEAEVALVLAKDIDSAEATAEALAAAVDYAVAAIEIVDSRIANWKITFADTVADNGSSSHFVLGSDRRSLKALDLWSCGMVLEINDQVVSVGAGAACLGHPLNAAAWLARTLAKAGEPLRAGDVVLTGALGPMAAVMPGDRVRATVGGLGQASFTYLGENADG